MAKLVAGGKSNKSPILITCLPARMIYRMSALGQNRTSSAIAIYVRYWGLSRRERPRSGHWLSDAVLDALATVGADTENMEPETTESDGDDEDYAVVV